MQHQKLVAWQSVKYYGFSQSEPVNTTGPYHQTPNKEYAEILESLDVLIIDEISMVRADHFDMINTALKITKRNSNPFGGVQLFLRDIYFNGHQPFVAMN